MLGEFLDFLFPPRCAICAADVERHGQICAECWGKFNWIGDPKCAKCGYPFPANIERDKGMLCPDCVGRKKKLDWMRAAAVYDDASRAVMLPFKHGGRLEYRELMSRAMIRMLKELPPNIDAKLLVMPVPLAARRLWKRGYNQASLLARPIAKALGADIDYDSVKRIFRADMGHKNLSMRKRNVAGVFRIRRTENIKGRAVLLVDDVHTTGATFEELAKTLKKAGAKWVGGVTFCRTIRAI